MTTDAERSLYMRGAAFALRVTVAAVLALVVAKALDLKMPLWVVLTALIVTQTSLGRSLKTTLDYFLGTLCGAVWGGLVAFVTPGDNPQMLLAALALALAPLAFATALDPRWTAAPASAVFVLLVPQLLHMSATNSAIERVLEVGLGGLIGLVVSIVFLPASAYDVVREKAADALDHMGGAISGLIGGLSTGLDAEASRKLQLALGPLLGGLQGDATEADRERSVRRGAEDTGPLLRSLLRLRHDLVMIGRSVGKPLPDALTSSATPSYEAAARALSAYFRDSAAALRQRKPAPLLDAVDATVTACTQDVEAARRARRLSELTSDEVEHLFAFVFAIEQMRRNLVDLKRCIDEWAR
jgi:uncharacterized membrane protein YccC